MVIVALARYEFHLGLLQPIFVISRRHFLLPDIISVRQISQLAYQISAILAFMSIYALQIC